MSDQVAPAYPAEDKTPEDNRSRFMNHEHGVPEPTKVDDMGIIATAATPSVTRKYRTPDGTVYVTYAVSPHEIWIDCTVGKGGTAMQASAHALAAVAGTALRHGTPTDKVAFCLRGVTHERSVRFGNDALSVPDALGLAIQAGA